MRAPRGAILVRRWRASSRARPRFPAGIRRAYLRRIAAAAGRAFEPAPDTNFAQRREDLLDLLANLVEEHLDGPALRALIDDGAPPGLPVIPPGAPT